MKVYILTQWVVYPNAYEWEREIRGVYVDKGEADAACAALAAQPKEGPATVEEHDVIPSTFGDRREEEPPLAGDRPMSVTNDLRELSARMNAIVGEVEVLTRVVSKIIVRLKDEKSFWQTDAVIGGIEKRLGDITRRICDYEMKLFDEKCLRVEATEKRAKKRAKRTKTRAGRR